MRIGNVSLFAASIVNGAIVPDLVDIKTHLQRLCPEKSSEIASHDIWPRGIHERSLTHIEVVDAIERDEICASIDKFIQSQIDEISIVITGISLMKMAPCLHGTCSPTYVWNKSHRDVTWIDRARDVCSIPGEKQNKINEICNERL
jgi:hypothetical protein